MLNFIAFWAIFQVFVGVSGNIQDFEKSITQILVLWEEMEFSCFFFLFRVLFLDHHENNSIFSRIIILLLFFEAIVFLIIYFLFQRIINFIKKTISRWLCSNIMFFFCNICDISCWVSTLANVSAGCTFLLIIT